jgi:hypothetical protein
VVARPCRPSKEFLMTSSVWDTQPNAGATGRTGSWTLEEDANLTHAVAKTFKTKYSKEFKIDWDVCRGHDGLDGKDLDDLWSGDKAIANMIHSASVFGLCLIRVDCWETRTHALE